MSASSKKKLRKEENAAKLTEKQLAEQKEAKKLKGYTLAFAIVVSLVLVLAIGIMAVTAFNNSGILERNTDALTVGEHTLTNAELNYFYIDQVNEYYSNWYNQYGDYTDMYLSMMGLDTTKPLSEQAYPGSETGESYADYFTDMAITSAANTYAVYDEAVAAGHTASEDAKANVDTTFQTLEMYASLNGYPNTEDYLKAIYGNGTTEKTFRNYLDVLAMVESYQTACYNALSYDDAAISAHNKEHFDDYSYFSYCQYLVDVDDFIDCPDPDNKEHTHSVKEVSDAEAAAKAAAEALVAGGYTTATALDEAINKLDVFAGAETKEACTQNEDILFTNIYNEELAAWLADDARTEGELTMLPYTYTSTAEDGTESTKLYGYYVILFQSRDDNETNLVNVRHILAQFTGGTKDSNTGVTTYSEDEKKMALDEITAVKEQWLTNGGTEEAFIDLVKDNSDDTGSSANGGLYEDVYPGQMVESFNDWCFAEGRKTGDYEIVETEYGYHLIYFVNACDVTFRNYMIENTLRNADFEAWYTEVTETAEAKELNTKYLSLDMVLRNS